MSGWRVCILLPEHVFFFFNLKYVWRRCCRAEGGLGLQSRSLRETRRNQVAGVSVTSVTLSLAAQTLGPIGSGFGLWGHSQDAFVDLCSPQLPGFSTPLAPLMAPRGGSGGIMARAGPPPPSGLSAVPGPHGLHTLVERGRPGPAGGQQGPPPPFTHGTPRCRATDVLLRGSGALALGTTRTGKPCFPLSTQVQGCPLHEASRAPRRGLCSLLNCGVRPCCVSGGVPGAPHRGLGGA